MFKSFREIKIGIGGITFLLRAKDSLLLPFYFEEFISDKEPDVEFTCLCSSLPTLEGYKVIAEYRNNWRIYQKEREYAIESYNSRLLEENKVVVDRILLTDENFSKGIAYLPSEKVYQEIIGEPHLPCWTVPSFFVPFGELILVNFLSHREGIMLHGAALKYKGEGLVFLGPTEAGKSTMIRLWKEEREAEGLSDETIIVRKEKGIFFVYGTPRGGSERVHSPEKAPIKEIFFIEHGKTNQVTPLPPYLAIQRLFPQIFLPFWSKERLEKISILSQELVSSFSCKVLSFVKDRSVVDYLKSIVTED